MNIITIPGKGEKSLSTPTSLLKGTYMRERLMVATFVAMVATLVAGLRARRYIGCRSSSITGNRSSTSIGWRAR